MYKVKVMCSLDLARVGATDRAVCVNIIIVISLSDQIVICLYFFKSRRRHKRMEQTI